MKQFVMASLAATIAWGTTAQNTVGTIEYDSENALDGYNMVVPLFGKDAMLVDMCGEVVHTWESADSLRFSTWCYLQDNGDLVMTLRQASVANDVIWAGGGGGIIERRNWDNDLLWSYELNDSLYRLHHDIHVMENGNVLALVWELKDSLEYIATYKPGEGETAAPGFMGAYRMFKDESLWRALNPMIEALKTFGSELDNEAGRSATSDGSTSDRI